MPTLADHLVVVVREHGSRLAVCDGGGALTYRELWDSAVAVARGLRPDVTDRRMDGVLVSCRRSLAAAVAFWCSIQLRLPYIPAYRTPTGPSPADLSAVNRTAALVTDDPSLAEDVDNTVVVLDHRGQITHKVVRPPRGTLIEKKSELPAYVIHTSGSTGSPKGVVIGQAAALAHAREAHRLYGLSAKDVVVQTSSLSSIASIEEMVAAWMVGGRVHLRSENMLASAADFFEVCEREEISVAILSTAYWHALVQSMAILGTAPPSRLRLVAFAGEPASREMYEVWQSLVGRGLETMNVYGLTETTGLVTAATSIDLEAEPRGPILPVGRPVVGMNVAIRDGDESELSAGKVGDVYVSGTLLADGFTDPRRTVERFIESQGANSVLDRWLRTGDLGLIREDGQLAITGRADRCIKIRGYQVDPEITEAILKGCPGVAAVAVTPLVKSYAYTGLEAHIVLAAEGWTIASVHDFADRRLPEINRPRRITAWQSLPRTSSGKIDYRLLMRG